MPRSELFEAALKRHLKPMTLPSSRRLLSAGTPLLNSTSGD
jgi:hypothetical protein